MTREEAIEEIQFFMTHDSLADAPSNEACKLAVAALREQEEREKNEPLSPEELREMDGEPVWAEHYAGGEWVTVHWNYADEIATAYKACLRKSEYGETWMAYRHKTEDKSEDATR